MSRTEGYTGNVAAAVAVLDRVPVLGGSGPLFLEVLASLAAYEFRPPCFSFVGGLGGRDLSVHTFRKMLMKTEKMIGKENPFSSGEYFDVRNHAFTEIV